MDLHSKVVRLALASGALLFGAGAVALAAYSGRPAGIVPEGVKVAGMAWGGKSADAARADLAAWAKAKATETIALTLPAATGVRKSWTPTLAEIGAEPDADATVGAALTAKQDEGRVDRFMQWLSGPKTVIVAPRWKVDTEKLKRYLARRVAPAARKDKQDARIVLVAGAMQVLPEHSGTALDVEGAVKALPAQLGGGAAAVELPVQTVAPKVRAADLHGIDGEISSYHTSYNETGNRARNIRVACSKINGTVLLPGQRFSYNDVVGPREAENGFRLAPVIIKGRLQPGMGGGVCQVSSTLYNAVLLGDLKIVRRSHHAFPVHYLPAGRDATVAYASIDFQFENSTDAPLAVLASGDNQQVSMRLFGKRVPGRQVKLERVKVSTWGPGLEVVRDSDLGSGSQRTIDKGHAGHRVTVIRTVLVGGKQVKREVISQDYYKAFPRIVAVGTRVAVHRASAPSAAPSAASPAVAQQ